MRAARSAHAALDAVGLRRGEAASARQRHGADAAEHRRRVARRLSAAMASERGLVIARSVSDEAIQCFHRLDCFVSLAMTLGRHAPAGLHLALGRSRKLRELLGRPHRTAHQLAAAIRAAALQPAFGAGAAEGALEGADHRLARLRRKVAVAAFAVGTQREHPQPPLIAALIASTVPPSFAPLMMRASRALRSSSAGFILSTISSGTTTAPC